MNQKSLITFMIVVIAVLLIAVAYLIGASKISSPIQPATTQNTTPKNSVPTAQSQPVATPAKVVYTNNEFGFRINLPVGWEKYKAIAIKEPGIRGLSSVNFLMPTADKKWPTEENSVTHEKFPGYASMFVVSIWDKALWEKEKNSAECKNDPNPGCPFESEVVTKSDKYVFTVSLGQDYPDDSAIKEIVPESESGTIDGDSFQAVFTRMFEIVK